MALRSLRFVRWSNLPSSSPNSQIALMILFAFFWSILLPITRAETFSSSLAFQSMNSSISGCDKSRQTIFAARRVVPPDLIAPAALSPIFRKDSSPLDVPPPESGSPLPRIFEKFDPVPEPYLNRRASLFQSPIIESVPPTKLSLTLWIKHACGCGCS